MSAGPRLIVALDRPDRAAALETAARLDPACCAVKVGKELFTAAGPGVVEALQARGFRVFLDLKFHDIPNTVAGACRAAAALGVWMLNVHALGGRRMMEAAREAVDGAARPPVLLAVTVLTSMGKEDLAEVGIEGPPEAAVLRLARLAHASGMDGVVCSPRELRALRAALGSGFRLVTPGVRPAGAPAGDQRRTATPAEAVAAGADHLVIGRPVTQADDPVGVLLTIESEIGRLTAPRADLP
ncbi:MAG TPA: orotidine-5'-phosphate decarboxylase [Chromatiales bacterium]|nr:orotidine-5'-phosphate decarboxylase [Chromatiales bacterium]